VLAGPAFEQWQTAQIGIVGGGILGSRLAPEFVRSGASVIVFDPSLGEPANLGTQVGIVPGRLKAQTVCEACNSIAPGRCIARTTDIRHVGVGELAQLACLIDASDDPGLAPLLTEISNGVGVPLIRVALDGTGEIEIGRVLVSHGGAGHACQMCSYSVLDLERGRSVQPCAPGEPIRPPTHANNGTAMAVAGICVLQTMRLVGGHDRDLVLDSEAILDLTHLATYRIRLQRSELCLSGHLRWNWQHLDVSAAHTRFADLYRTVCESLGGETVELEFYGHPLYTRARCEHCATDFAAAGSPWAATPACPRCGGLMVWRAGTEQACWTWDEAKNAGLLVRTLTECGLPERGAMVIARSVKKPATRFLLS
jgi:hypothetical protein